jgi:hypothetical protein
VPVVGSRHHAGPATLWLPDYIHFEGTIVMPVETPDRIVNIPVSRSRHH